MAFEPVPRMAIGMPELEKIRVINSRCSALLKSGLGAMAFSASVSASQPCIRILLMISRGALSA